MNDVLIETYEVEEAEWAGDEMDKEKYLQLIDACGLEGQKKIIQNEGAIPFQRLSEQDKRVWQAFCPGKYKATAYAQGVIPLRVLGLINVCTERKYFQRIEIWTENANAPDPVVVGIMATSDYSTDAVYLIARWGHALLSWPEVVKQAHDKWKVNAKASLERTIAEAKTKLESLDALCADHMNGGWVNL